MHHGVSPSRCSLVSRGWRALASVPLTTQYTYPTIAYTLYSHCDSEELDITPIPTSGKDATTMELVHIMETLLPEQVSQWLSV